MAVSNKDTSIDRPIIDSSRILPEYFLPFLRIHFRYLLAVRNVFFSGGKDLQMSINYYGNQKK
jgi:hypothetical protein